MRFVAGNYFQLSLILLLACPGSALAIPAITCHCFTDRSYDPARPTLADPYFLATTRNSFFAAAFAVDKKTIVMKKQQGASAEELWIAYWLASRSGADPESLLQARKTKGTWRPVVAAQAIPAKTLGRRFSEALQANAADDRLADIVVDDLLLRFRIYGEVDLVALRKANAGNQEIIIAAMIASKTRQPALVLYLDLIKGSKSWGALLEKAGIKPAEIQKEIEALISRSRQPVRGRKEGAL